MATVTNRKYSQALKGESVLVTLDATDSAQLADFSIGQECTIPTNKTGYIDRIDLYGHSFGIKPSQPDKALNSDNAPGYLEVSETITIS